MPPLQPEHPALALSKLLSEEVKAQLLKTPPVLPLEAEIYRQRLTDLRDDWKFGFVVQWCYLFKSIIKLNDHFDVDSFEEELLQLNPPSFITRLKTQLVHYLTGEKISDSYIEDTGEFENALQQLIPRYFLEKYSTDDEIENFKFFKLSVSEQIDVYHQLISLANDKNDALRKLIDQKFDASTKIFRQVLTINHKKSQLQYIILPDLRLYCQELTFDTISIPYKKSEMELTLAKTDIKIFLEALEPRITGFKCIATGIYELDQFINSQSKTSVLFKSLKEYYDEISENDIKRRKQELSRQRQIKLQSLMVHRKRSSRIEERELKRKEEEEQERIDLERRKKEAAAVRLAKRMKLRGDEYQTRESSTDHMSREERYRRKHTATVTPEVDSNSVDVSTSELNAEPVSDVKTETENTPVPESALAPVAEFASTPVVVSELVAVPESSLVSISEPSVEPVSQPTIASTEPIPTQLTKPEEKSLPVTEQQSAPVEDQISEQPAISTLTNPEPEKLEVTQMPPVSSLSMETAETSLASTVPQTVSEAIPTPLVPTAETHVATQTFEQNSQQPSNISSGPIDSPATSNSSSNP